MDNRFIAIELRALNNAVRRYLENSEPQISGDKLTCSNAWIIGHLYHAEGEVFQKDLEETFGVTRSTISKVLALLEKKGVIRRVGVLHDARVKRLVLTDKGRELAEALEENGARMESKLADGFTESELLQLAEYMQRMRKNLGDSGETEGKGENRYD